MKNLLVKARSTPRVDQPGLRASLERGEEPGSKNQHDADS